jgi:hypothetical protein
MLVPCGFNSAKNASSLFARLYGIDPDLLHCFRLYREAGFTRGKFINSQQVGQNTNIGFAAQRLRFVEGHCGANPFEQIAHRQIVPIREEIGPR